jgi:hypothetical protein
MVVNWTIEVAKHNVRTASCMVEVAGRFMVP